MNTHIYTHIHIEHKHDLSLLLFCFKYIYAHICIYLYVEYIYSSFNMFVSNSTDESNFAMTKYVREESNFFFKNFITTMSILGKLMFTLIQTILNINYNLNNY